MYKLSPIAKTIVGRTYIISKKFNIFSSSNITFILMEIARGRIKIASLLYS